MRDLRALILLRLKIYCQICVS